MARLLYGRLSLNFGEESPFSLAQWLPQFAFPPAVYEFPFLKTHSGMVGGDAAETDREWFGADPGGGQGQDKGSASQAVQAGYYVGY